MTIICQNNIFTKCYIRYWEVSQCERAEPGPPCLTELGLTAQVQEFKTKARNRLPPQGAGEIQKVTSNESPLTYPLKDDNLPSCKQSSVALKESKQRVFSIWQSTHLIYALSRVIMLSSASPS